MEWGEMGKECRLKKRGRVGGSKDRGGGEIRRGKSMGW